MVSFSQTGVLWVWFIVLYWVQSRFIVPQNGVELSLISGRSTLASVPWWSPAAFQFTDFGMIFCASSDSYNTCCSHCSALGLVLSQWVSAVTQLLPELWMGAEWCYTTHPWTPAQICSLALALRKGLGLSALQGGCGISHSKTPRAVSSSGFAPRAAHLIIPLQHPPHQHSAPLALSNPSWSSVPPGRCWASTSTCFSENEGNAQPPSWLNLYLAFFSNTQTLPF